MRFIDKSSRCKEFDSFTEKIKHIEEQKWGLLTKEEYITVHNHILRQQKTLCIYCQKQLIEKKESEWLPPSIIEHIRPRTKYPELTYEFTNLAVACKKHIDKKEVKETKPLTKEDIDFCEDRKDDEYNEDRFLNPHEVTDIESYFEYDIEGNIFAKEENEKANYMIKTALNLNHAVLINMRKDQYLIFENMPIEEVENILLDEDVEQLPAFYSMLKNLLIK